MSLKKKIFSAKYTAGILDEFQVGSQKRVLKNLLGITSVREMQKTELAGYLTAERKVMTEFSQDQRLTLNDIHRINKWFLGNIYSWAGTTRSVNITKGDFTFATAYALPQALKDFERDVLSQHTPCRGKLLEEIAHRIAVVHCELLLLHPYREGNGRTARLVATLMAYQAGLPGIDFSFIGGRGKEFENYISAVRDGLRKHYVTMTEIVLRALRRALRRAGASSIA